MIQGAFKKYLQGSISSYMYNERCNISILSHNVSQIVTNVTCFKSAKCFDSKRNESIAYMNVMYCENILNIVFV